MSDKGEKKRGRPGSDKWECVDCVGENEGEEARYPGDDMSCLLGATNHVFLQRRPPSRPEVESPGGPTGGRCVVDHAGSRPHSRGWI